VLSRSSSTLEKLARDPDVLTNFSAEFFRKAMLEEVTDRRRKLTDRNGRIYGDLNFNKYVLFFLSFVDFWFLILFRYSDLYN